mmetsp:Transcript_60563/g.144018  ORF Transcript_60563/g.144018 Transcript_60563/m.144018 type:complete len:209 (+) Transcript_60563:304-930(+)
MRVHHDVGVYGHRVVYVRGDGSEVCHTRVWGERRGTRADERPVPVPRRRGRRTKEPYLGGLPRPVPGAQDHVEADLLPQRGRAPRALQGGGARPVRVPANKTVGRAGDARGVRGAQHAPGSHQLVRPARQRQGSVARLGRQVEPPRSDVLLQRGTRRGVAGRPPRYQRGHPRPGARAVPGAHRAPHRQVRSGAAAKAQAVPAEPPALQ